MRYARTVISEASMEDYPASWGILRFSPFIVDIKVRPITASRKSRRNIMSFAKV